ncbi:MAG: sugar transferase [Terrisporobacter othiniensis]|nr:sugar transferase [Terrisporobacter petrolearius]MDU4862741.1 sugar transferase [Terrisporobacter othiniensis]MDU6996746.1 sugar transferase [Terrisporobacter othiniensis]
MLKRIIDVLGSLFGIIILSPVYLLVSFLVYRNLGSPIIFRQLRPGKNGKIFEMMKFRSMLDKTNKWGEVLPDEERLTSFGMKLRNTSLDELPELFNVLKGEMSLVGPRPLLVEYLELYSEEQNKRHNMKPGITGLAQINGRNSISWSEKLNYDVEYVENFNILLDIKILFMTIYKVIKKEGISQEGNVTMEIFTGDN